MPFGDTIDAIYDYAGQTAENMRKHPFWPGWNKLIEAAQISGWGPPGVAPMVGMSRLPASEIFLPQGFNPVRNYSYGARLFTPETLKKAGLTPNTQGVVPGWETENLVLDYLPKGVKSYDQAMRYLQAVVGKMTSETNASNLSRFNDDLMSQWKP